VAVEGPLGRTPTFLTVGAQKAGTTALCSYLRRRPDVFMSPVKEPVAERRIDGSMALWNSSLELAERVTVSRITTSLRDSRCLLRGCAKLVFPDLHFFNLPSRGHDSLEPRLPSERNSGLEEVPGSFCCPPQARSVEWLAEEAPPFGAFTKGEAMQSLRRTLILAIVCRCLRERCLGAARRPGSVFEPALGEAGCSAALPLAQSAR